MALQAQGVRFWMPQWEAIHVSTAPCLVFHGMNACGGEELCERFLSEGDTFADRSDFFEPFQFLCKIRGISR
jgi:hypothetical protein